MNTRHKDSLIGKGKSREPVTPYINLQTPTKTFNSNPTTPGLSKELCHKHDLTLTNIVYTTKIRTYTDTRRNTNVPF